MASVGTLSVDLIAQTASFNANLDKAARNLNSNAAKMNRSLSGVQDRLDGMANSARLASLALAAGAFVEITKRSLEYASSLKETAQQVGVTAKQLQVFNYIGSQVGVTSEDMQKGLAKLTVSLGQAEAGAGKQGKAFAALGVDIRDANGHVLTAGDALPKIADALARVQDPAQRAAAEVALFGKAGQKLDTVLTEGSKGLENYAKQAEDAGMVISDSLIDKADAAADRMAALTTQLKVSFAREVAANADAILGLANALANLTTGALNFISTYPRLSAAMAGAAAGARFGGVPGALIGGVAAIAGMERFQAGSSMDLGVRTDRLQAATALMRDMMAQGQDKSNIAGFRQAFDNLNKQRALMTRAQAQAATLNAPALPPIAGVNLPDFMASGGGGKSSRARGAKGPSAESLRNRAIRDAEAFANQLSSIDNELLSVKRENVTDISQLVDITKQQINAEIDQLERSIRADVAAGQFTAAQGEQLREKAEQLRAEKLMTISIEQLQKKWDDDLEMQIAANDNQKDILEIQDQLAVTQADRQRIQLSILDAERRNLELELQKELLNSKDVEERKRIQAKIDAMPAQYAGRADVIRDQTAGPLQSYIKSMDPRALQERVEALQVDQLEAVQDGINNAISSALGVQDPFLSGLIDMFIEQVLIRPIAEALQKTSGGGGGLFGSLLGLAGGIIGGGLSASGIASSNLTVGDTIASNPNMFAKGTLSAPAGWAIVGEQGPEAVRFRGGEQVYNQKMLRSLAANDSINVHVTVQGGGSERQNRETGTQVGNAAARQIAGARRYGVA